LAGKLTAGLPESNGSLPQGGWLKVTCGLTACAPASAPGPTLGNEYRRTSPFYVGFYVKNCIFEHMTDKIFTVTVPPSQTLALPAKMEC